MPSPFANRSTPVVSGCGFSVVVGCLAIISVPALAVGSEGVAVGSVLWGAAIIFMLGGALWLSYTRYLLQQRTQELESALERCARIEQQHQQLLTIDQQTGLAKQQHFMELLDDYFHAPTEAQSVSKEVMLIKLLDLDVVVRSLGFTRAELIVTTFASLLQALPQTQAAYFGRGVFALFMTKTNAPQLFKELSKKIADADLGCGTQLVGGSSYWPEQGRSASKLVRHAETALATSVARRKRWMLYDAAMEPSRLDMEIVSTFVKGNVQGLYPVFQPQLNLRTGRIESAEVLERWNHWQLGVIAPSVFIPLLEHSGLIEQVTLQMVDEAVRVGAYLRKQHMPCCISVNVAAYDLLEANLPDIISQALLRHRGMACDIKVELTETCVASDPQHVKTVLTQLNAMGVLASVDDFGTGYSSLSYLNSFPIHELKIDRSFVGDMLHNERNHSIVRSTISLARELGLVVVAEGVEDDKTLQLLKKEGCEVAQGFVIAKPMAETDFIEFMRTHAVESIDFNRIIRSV